MTFRRMVIDAIVVCAIGVVCLPILLALAPNIEQPRGEARVAHTYGEVQRLHSILDETPTSIRELEELDPWGQPYRVIPLGNGAARVISSGQDKSLSPDGADGDDIYSDMPTSPMAPIREQQNRQWLIAFTVTAGTWLLLALLYIRSRRTALN